jgi:hypothetical protein
MLLVLNSLLGHLYAYCKHILCMALVVAINSYFTGLRQLVYKVNQLSTIRTGENVWDDSFSG